jgi:hypothetical protein
MRHLLRKPLTWMIVAECLVVAALMVVSWQLLAGHPAASDIAVLAPQPSEAPASPAPPHPAHEPSPTKARQLPGLNVDPVFWGLKLSDVNQDEAALEKIEWQLTHAALEAAHNYLQSVVIPAVQHAESK